MKQRWLIIAVGILGLSLALVQQFKGQPTLVTFFDIGQGDAALVRTKFGQTILIDGGPDRTILQKLGAAMPWGEKSIDLVILSHPHADHVTGLTYVLERYRVRQVLMTGAVHTTPEYLRFLELVKEQNIPTTIARAGQRFTLDGDVAVEVLWPEQSFVGVRVDDLNDTSIVNRVTFGARSVMFTGDTPSANEAALLAQGADLKADILKVSHQGSRTSSSEEFVRAVSPAVAVISVGAKNRYGHPHADVVQRLQRLVPTVLRTDQVGDITFTLEDNRWVRR